MIAAVTVPGFGRAELGGDGVWAADHPDLARHLNAFYAPGSFGGVEAILPFGQFAADQAAADAGGTVEHARPPGRLPDGVVS